MSSSTPHAWSASSRPNRPQHKNRTKASARLPGPFPRQGEQWKSTAKARSSNTYVNMRWPYRRGRKPSRPGIHIKKAKEKAHRARRQHRNSIGGSFRSLHKHSKAGWQAPNRPHRLGTAAVQAFSGDFQQIPAATSAASQGSHSARSAAPLQASTRETIPTRRSATGSGDMGVQQKLRTRANSHDAVQAMLQYPQWSQIILHELDDMLYKGPYTQELEGYLLFSSQRSLSFGGWGDCRPIALSSTLLKLLEQLLLGRAGEQIQQGGATMAASERVARVRTHGPGHPQKGSPRGQGGGPNLGSQTRHQKSLRLGKPSQHNNTDRRQSGGTQTRKASRSHGTTVGSLSTALL